jgi:hypothetical protein
MGSHAATEDKRAAIHHAATKTIAEEQPCRMLESN